MAQVEDLYCANDASVIWVDTYNGEVEFMCAAHIPDPDDEELKPVETYQSSRWEIIEYTATHRLTRHAPVAMKDCPDDAFRRAVAIAERLAEYDARSGHRAGGARWPQDCAIPERMELRPAG